MKKIEGDRTVFFLRARVMEEEALSCISSPLGRMRDLPRMTEEELIDQARRFKAVAWVQAVGGDCHKVGLSRRGRLAFSHHTVKELRRMAAFEELGGEACPCLRFFRIFDRCWDLGVPPHFRDQLRCAMSRRRLRETTRKAQAAARQAGPPSQSLAAAAFRVIRAQYPGRISGRRVGYDQGL